MVGVMADGLLASWATSRLSNGDSSSPCGLSLGSFGQSLLPVKSLAELSTCQSKALFLLTCRMLLLLWPLQPQCLFPPPPPQHLMPLHEKEPVQSFILSQIHSLFSYHASGKNKKYVLLNGEKAV